MNNFLFSLGKHYVSDFAKSFNYTDLVKYDLGLQINSDGAVHLTEQPPASQMWGKYWYRTGMNKSMVNQMGDIVNSIIQRIQLNPNDIWLDIACNDGTMFKFMPDYIDKVGIDPAEDTYFSESSKLASVKQDFFSKEVYYSIREKKAKVITTIAMFYDLQNPDEFIKNIDAVLDKDGLWVIQISYTPLMLKQLAFDNICHEHYYYYSLKSLNTIFKRNGFVVTDVSLNDTNGGSCRVFIQRENNTQDH